MKKFDLVIFDLGKVLIDFDFNIAIAKLDKFAPIDRAKVMALFMNSKLARDWDRGMLNPKQFYAIIKKELNLPIEMDEFIPIWNDIFSPKEEMIDLALRFAKNHKTVIVSNTNPWHSQHIMKKYHWLKEFKEFIASCEVKLLKPDHEIFHLTLSRADASPKKTLYIDDIQENIVSATKLGIDAIQFKSHTLLLDELKIRGV